ncbi:MAG TPA: hypothetical protein VGM56_28595 [Byssovorax sp.]|jgi:hypothetical protein
MTTATVLVATWTDGLYALGEARRAHELAGQAVRGLAADGRGGTLAIVGAHALERRDAGGAWSTLLDSELELASCVAIGDVVYVGTDDARVLRVAPGGHVEELRSFGAVAGRDTWYAGAAVVDGRLMGPPLGVRSMTATADGALLVNVHVGGIPRSPDGGTTWAPTLAVESDVHEVRAHPTRARIAIAASAVGLWSSRDGGATWALEHAGLHARYCSAVAFVGDDVYVAASEDHFAKEGAVYRRSVDGAGPLMSVGGGFPERTQGIADTGCIDARGGVAAVCDQRGNLYVSVDAGRTWARRGDGTPGPSCVLIV